jgi:hypothetical protein
VVALAMQVRVMPFQLGKAGALQFKSSADRLFLTAQRVSA